MSDEEKTNQKEVEEVSADAQEVEGVVEASIEEATDHPEEPKATKDPVEVTEAVADPEPVEGVEDQATAEEDAVVEELPNRDIKPGMLIRVHERIVDVSPKGEERKRVQVFEGIVMGLGSKGIARTMTVRKDSKGFMVEKIFPLSSPNIVKVEVKKQYRVRRAKLSHLRGDFKRKMKEDKGEQK